MILVVTVLPADVKRSNPCPLWLAVIGKLATTKSPSRRLRDSSSNGSRRNRKFHDNARLPKYRGDTQRNVPPTPTTPVLFGSCAK